MKMPPRLDITQSDRREHTVEVIRTATIGRDDDNDIPLDEITVSRCHVLLVPHAEEVALLDLGNTNGTFVNGVQAPPDEPVCLRDGDVITIGRVVMRYHAPRMVY